MSLPVYPKHGKEQEQYLETAYVILHKKKSNRETPVSEIAFILKKWVFIIREIFSLNITCA
jgi:hypothetical protein